MSTGQGFIGCNMFAYCRNNPASRIDIAGYADTDIEEEHDDEIEVVPKVPAIAGVGGISGGTSNSFQSTGSLETTRVGRWMSQQEYDQMVSTGRVQMSPNGNTTYVANPADISAFQKQAKPGSIYVEFDVESARIYPGGKIGWAQIPGPGSLYDRYRQCKGLTGFSDMPYAYNVQMVKEK